MSFQRRQFLTAAAAGMLLAAMPTGARAGKQFKAVAFDGFPIFDPRPVAALAETLFPGNGAVLSTAWRTRQFEYQWLRALAGRYSDFREATDSALTFAATSLQLDLTADKRAQLMNLWANLDVWPDVPAAVASLRKAGVRLAILSNMTQKMLDEGIQRAGLNGQFEHVISTDRVQSYKPDPRAYRLTMDAMKLKPGEILFAAFAGWDVAGAKWFGHPTFWVNRLKSPMEEIGNPPDAMGSGMQELVEFALTGA
ncbi:MAG TPA: haloacid dehalogenase type II [Burkholderiales bacterium]|nr:haloacid dehalogenase type II [Burkholderiales bacterium]